MNLSELPKTRKEALKLGLTHYYTGKPCKNGHISKRTVHAGKCFGCMNEYRGERKDRDKKYRKTYYEQNREMVLERQKEYHGQNKHKERKRLREYYKNNKELFFTKGRNRRALERNAEGNHTASDVQILLQKQEFKCASCSIDVTKNYHVDHIMPLALGGSNNKSNLQILCPTCNLTKGRKHPDVWFEEVAATR